ncbi:uncharacterized protein DDB_G0283357-like [Microplitis mediator]|uniref:uncharacterized protein DDB_G0283357-like n=1 Tax=Microplitis mediator TaxID=375433 RepID=UPI0025551845|nr:uncharacterized protein DDB_G0283357-like [Microplitis mediator]
MMFIKLFKFYYFVFSIFITLKISFGESLDSIGHDSQSSSVSIAAFDTKNTLKVVGKNHTNVKGSVFDDLNETNGTRSGNDNLVSNKNSVIGSTISHHRSVFFEHGNNTLVNCKNNLDVQGAEKFFPSGTITLGPEKTFKDIVNCPNKSGVIGDEKVDSMLGNNKKIKVVVNMTSTHQSIDTTWKKRLVDPSTVSSLLVAPSAQGQSIDVINSMINSSVSNNHFQTGAMAEKINDGRVDDYNNNNNNNEVGSDDDNNGSKTSKRRFKRGKCGCKKWKSAEYKSSVVDIKKPLGGRRSANLDVNLNKNFNSVRNHENYLSSLVTSSKSVFTTIETTSTITTTTTPLISTLTKLITEMNATIAIKKIPLLKINSKRKKCPRKRGFKRKLSYRNKKDQVDTISKV